MRRHDLQGWSKLQGLAQLSWKPVALGVGNVLQYTAVYTFNACSEAIFELKVSWKTFPDSFLLPRSP